MKLKVTVKQSKNRNFQPKYKWDKTGNAVTNYCYSRFP